MKTSTPTFSYSLFFIFCTFLTIHSSAQVGIGTTDPKAEALLDIHSIEGNKGILIPRVQLIGLNSLAPIATSAATESLLIYNTNATIGKGFYYWNGSNQWVAVGAENGPKTWHISGASVLPEEESTNTFTLGTVSIGTSNTSPDASLLINNQNKGILINKVSLVAANQTSSIESPTQGLLLYNTSTSGTGDNAVSPGFYYWGGNKWLKLGEAKHYATQHTQQIAKTAENIGTAVSLPGLSHTFTAPFSGTYQIAVTGYYTAGAVENPTHTQNFSSSTGTTNEVNTHGNNYHDHTVNTTTPVVQGRNGFAEASLLLDMNGTTIAEQLLSAQSISLYPEAGSHTGSANAVILINVVLQAGTTYTFDVKGVERIRHNTETGIFGKDLTTPGVSSMARSGKMNITYIN